MNFQSYFEELKSSNNYKNFMKNNPDSFFCSGFFILDKESKNSDQQHFDFYTPSKKEMVSFCISDTCQKTPVEMIDKSIIPEKIPENNDFDFREIEYILLNKMKQENIKNKVQKILLSLQTKENKSFLVGTVFISMLGLLKVNIDLPEKKIVLFEKKSIFDMVRRVK